MLLGECDESFVGFATGVATGRHIGIVGPHQSDKREVHLLQFVKVGLPSVVLTQIVIDNLGTENLAQRRVCRITGIGHQHLFAWIDKGQCHMQNAFLRTNERLHLGLRVNIDTIPALVESCHCLTQLRRTHCGLIAMCLGL